MKSKGQYTPGSSSFSGLSGLSSSNLGERLGNRPNPTLATKITLLASATGQAASGAIKQSIGKSPPSSLLPSPSSLLPPGSFDQGNSWGLKEKENVVYFALSTPSVRLPLYKWPPVHSRVHPAFRGILLRDTTRLLQVARGDHVKLPIISPLLPFSLKGSWKPRLESNEL